MKIRFNVEFNQTHLMINTANDAVCGKTNMIQATTDYHCQNEKYGKPESTLYYSVSEKKWLCEKCWEKLMKEINKEAT